MCTRVSIEKHVKPLFCVLCLENPVFGVEVVGEFWPTMLLFRRCYLHGREAFAVLVGQEI